MSDDSDSLHVGRYRDVLEQLGDGEPTTALEANALIKSIRDSKGYLDEKTRLAVETIEDIESREFVLRTFEARRELEAAYTKSISEQLYTSKYRFLYELVQNADDSQYHRVDKQSVSPFLRFSVTPNTLIVETNEDGFKRANVQAICSTGKSSKKTSALNAHIGEKGFGFKSVFSVASEVHVQSGVWSFQFRHRRGEDGLGMVTPLEAKPEILPVDVTTRITLRLVNDTSKEYEKLLDAVADMPDTTIFFLRRLRMIHIDTDTSNGQWTKTTFEKQILGLFGRWMKLIRSDKSKKASTTDTSLYHCVKHHIIDKMPVDERRRGCKSVVIELAFPVMPATQQPKLNGLGQHLFAFLPLQRLPQIQFLIQSDFITSANREGVIDCAWNEAIREGVAKAFAMAVERFATAYHPLRYSWLDYLPTGLREDRWKTLYPSIIKELSKMPILQTWQQRLFRPPGELRVLPSYMLYNGNPILRDLPNELYLAPDYACRHHPALGALGAVYATLKDMIKRLEADISDTRTPRMKTTAPGDLWHEAFAKLFLSAWSTTSSDALTVQNRLKRLPVIPLTNRNQWAGAPGASFGSLRNIYFSSTGDVPIPDSLPLKLLDRTASSNTKRKEFYRALGVEDCQQELVVAEIKKMHLLDGSIAAVETHLQYLFHVNQDPRQLKKWMWVPTKDGKIVRNCAKLYFPSKKKYDMYQLFLSMTQCSKEKVEQGMAFLKQSLLDLESDHPNNDGLTWNTWLEQATGARYHPPLLHEDGESPKPTLSSALLAILLYKNSSFLGTLKEHWQDYQQDAFKVKDRLMACVVNCTPNMREPLQDSYLPTRSVVERASELGLSTVDFPILSLPGFNPGTDKLEKSGYMQWQFLEAFGVRSKPDLDFYQRALQKISESSSDPTMQILNDLYTSMAEIATGQDRENLREFFQNNKCIWDPAGEEWKTKEECIWRGPKFLRYTTVLATHYDECPLREAFFSNTLDINDWGVSDIIYELEYLFGCDEFMMSALREIYSFLDTNVHSDADWEELRNCFKKDTLILGTDNEWFSSKACLWKSPFSLSGYQELSILYPDLETFFTQRLKIKIVSPSMLIKEISQMTKNSEPDIENIRKRLIEVGMILAKGKIDSDVEDSLDELAQCKFLPQKFVDGSATLVDLDQDFAIPDHARFSDAFAEEDVLLDFTVEEVQIMDAMFQYMGLENRYLSANVREESSIRDDVNEDDLLSQYLQAKAYALYCCAAKHKSVKALRGDCTLFEELSTAVIFTANLTTHLVLEREDDELRVESDRPTIHHETDEGCLEIYVPVDRQQRRMCYRSQLPKLLANIVGVGSIAYHDMSVIVSSDLKGLDDILVEQDIPYVSWIQKPSLDISEDEEFTVSTPRLSCNNSIAHTEIRIRQTSLSSRCLSPSVSLPSETTLVEHATTPRTPASHTPRHTHPSEDESDDSHGSVPISPPPQYHDFVEQVLCIARRARFILPGFLSFMPLTLFAPANDPIPVIFDRTATFGNRSADQMAHDRRIGAAGEAFVFEMLNALNLAHFSRSNWQSTIRGELALHSHYADMPSWIGSETADIVYTDRDGCLTRWLRRNCTGGFPDEIDDDDEADFGEEPIKYFLEVKSTLGDRGSRFFLSGGQYRRMQGMEITPDERPKRVYVIMRVYNLGTQDVGLSIFVDPLSMNGSVLEFKVQGWVGRTL
ncbi:hypothetical protein EJ02DRAFT_457780 [Clathrospora elynae]|uniref:Protein NO VEIN C-terminal domain-containing protein n=1 Tax=Clathrospora elynae TaxID=706981 RepID=A0A6A5SD12_9PLEO|nr:hypothetical protein EJ02DRAFT_457780 [Clathrospora elynae]